MPMLGRPPTATTVLASRRASEVRSSLSCSEASGRPGLWEPSSSPDEWSQSRSRGGLFLASRLGRVWSLDREAGTNSTLAAPAQVPGSMLARRDRGECDIRADLAAAAGSPRRSRDVRRAHADRPLARWQPSQAGSWDHDPASGRGHSNPSLGSRGWAGMCTVRPPPGNRGRGPRTQLRVRTLTIQTQRPESKTRTRPKPRTSAPPWPPAVVAGLMKLQLRRATQAGLSRSPESDAEQQHRAAP
ncbi:hypothetical protein B2J93_803 [Marssonina coronariae]|uniref:Uncharacterized protein n=1 Tax=Diplocarpon coronariae TaxID=2795749 RepID=A0A218ZEI7_9HELO|nr:hypothetical protein B2J93_803 [Marssonina coronariae]